MLKVFGMRHMCISRTFTVRSSSKIYVDELVCARTFATNLVDFDNAYLWIVATLNR